MKALIRQRAWELGFDDCRITSAAPPESAGKLRDWLAQNQHGAMEWLQRNAEKRVDPQKVLPGAKSVICLAVSYSGSDECRATSDKARFPATRHGVVARYAQFDDYHDVL